MSGVSVSVTSSTCLYDLSDLEWLGPPTYAADNAPLVRGHSLLSTAS